MASLAVVLALEAKSSQRELTSRLLAQLVPSVLSCSDLETSLDQLLRELPDLVLDTPGAPQVSGSVDRGRGRGLVVSCCCILCYYQTKKQDPLVDVPKTAEFLLDSLCRVSMDTRGYEHARIHTYCMCIVDPAVGPCCCGPCSGFSSSGPCSGSLPVIECGPLLCFQQLLLLCVLVM